METPGPFATLELTKDSTHNDTRTTSSASTSTTVTTSSSKTAEIINSMNPSNAHPSSSSVTTIDDFAHCSDEVGSAVSISNSSTGEHTGEKCQYDNVIFDFDSTILKTESLEVMLSELLANDPEKERKMKEIEDWTTRGMNGEITFKEGLEARLNIAKPTKKSVDDFFVKFCPMDLTEGITEVVEELHKQDVNVFILSGGFSDLIKPFAGYLNIPTTNVFAVDINWDSEGGFESLNEDNGFVASKINGAEKIKHQFAGGKTLAVGDGYTDYMLYEKGIATHFIAYTEHAARDKVIKVAPKCAKDSGELKKLLRI